MMAVLNYALTYSLLELAVGLVGNSSYWRNLAQLGIPSFKHTRMNTPYRALFVGCVLACMCVWMWAWMRECRVAPSFFNMVLTAYHCWYGCSSCWKACTNNYCLVSDTFLPVVLLVTKWVCVLFFTLVWCPWQKLHSCVSQMCVLKETVWKPSAILLDNWGMLWKEKEKKNIALYIFVFWYCSGLKLLCVVP